MHTEKPQTEKLEKIKEPIDKPVVNNIGRAGIEQMFGKIFSEKSKISSCILAWKLYNGGVATE